MHISPFLAHIFLIPLLASAAVIPRQASTSTVYKFSTSGAWIENLASRSNGQLLLTRFDAPELWSLDLSTKTTAKVATFTGSTCTAGITEVSPDVFAVVTGNYSQAGGNKPGTWGVWKVNFTGTTPQASVVKMIPESVMFNGLTTLDNDTVLIGEGKGSVYRLSISNGNYSTAIQDAAMAPPSSAPVPIGIDGLKYYSGYVYFTNIFKNTFNKVQVDSTGKAMGAATTILTVQTGDDFSFGPDGSAYIAANGNVAKVTSAGKLSTVASVASGTSTTFGRTAKDNSTLYVGTSVGSVVSVAISS
jgi:hypothetical protein